MPEAELPYADGNERLREAHLHNGQAEATALFAPYFAFAGVGAAILVAWPRFDQGRLFRIIPWLAAVAFAHWWTYRKAVEAGAGAGSRSAKAQAEWRPVLEAVGLAVVWASLPVYAFSMHPA